jgi:ketosteroid isomerase-like protein
MTAKQLFLEAIRRSDAGDIDGFIALHGPDSTWVTPNAELHGHDELRGWLDVWVSGFPDDRRHELTRVVEVDDTVYCEGVLHGTNTGSMDTPEGTLPATGKPVAMRFSIVVDIDVTAGQATSVHLYFDQLGFLGQLGLVPAAA